VYHADVVANEIVSSDPVEVVERLLFVRSRPEWYPGADVGADDVYLYEGNLYRVVQSHKAQADWLPTVARSLWTRYYESDEIPEWVQPLGGFDAWPLGAKVLHSGFTWESLVANNVWQPGAVGTETLWRNLTPPPATTEWKAGVQYKVGDVVTYQGSSYRVLQAHTSQAGWTPPVVPALFLKL
jgi:hypothetical protein